MKQLLVLTSMMVLLSACATTTTTLRHPTTGHEVKCTGEETRFIPNLGPISLEAITKNDSSCIEKYLSQGYERRSASSSIF